VAAGRSLRRKGPGEDIGLKRNPELPTASRRSAIAFVQKHLSRKAVITAARRVDRWTVSFDDELEHGNPVSKGSIKHPNDG